MSGRAALLVGVMTVLLFLGIGVSLLLSERTLFGAVVLGLGLLRGGLLLAQARRG